MNKRPANARLLGALLLTGLALAMAACNAIIGLEPGEPEKTGSSSGSTASGIGGGTGVTGSASVATGSTGMVSTGTTGGSTSTSTSSTSSTGSGGSTCPAPAAAPVCGDHAWAHWHPEPGATCTDRFATTKDTVFDKVTGLTWQRTGPSIIQTWDTAVLYCDHYGDTTPYKWRLPTRIELASIADFSRKEPTIDLNVFTNTPPEMFWTSSTYAADKTKAWWVAFGGFSFNPGAINYDDKIRSHYIRCVR